MSTVKKFWDKWGPFIMVESILAVIVGVVINWIATKPIGDVIIFFGICAIISPIWLIWKIINKLF